MRKKRLQSVGEEIANAISHGVMVLFGILALILMLIKADNTTEVISSIIFGSSIILLYLMSTLYHSLAFTKAKGIFKRFDHLSIYILIGGTFAPALLLLTPLRNTPFFGLTWLDKGLALFIIQWLLIATGVVFKSIWVYKFSKVHVFLYLLLGWSAVIFISDLYNFSTGAFFLVLFGGISYSLGVIFYSLSKLRYFHFIWHLWVILGTTLQFFAVYLFLM